MSNLDKRYEITQFFEYSWYDIENINDNAFIIKRSAINIIVLIDERYIFLRFQNSMLYNFEIDYNFLLKLNDANKNCNIWKIFLNKDEWTKLHLEAIFTWFFDKKSFRIFMNNFDMDLKIYLECYLKRK